MDKITIALLFFFAVTAYTTQVPDGPYKIIVYPKHHDFVTRPCHLLKMKVGLNGKRTLGLGTCCDQNQWTDLRTVRGRAGGVTKLKIMSSDLNYVLTDKLEFVNTTFASSMNQSRVYFKTGLTILSRRDKTYLKPMSSPTKFLSGDLYWTKKVTLVNRESLITNFMLSNSTCQAYLQYPSFNYCKKIAGISCG
ncbi:uncharacterized protein LOC116287847 [Actinia tenebrosa]|uniref:Uncharacterized protein LOC116287847 n=1 Tax=Actinia tenebrosa TaxID=6105 RepID=A0A6P8HCZ1_ACTTE|nr:uncharacterized protein LOC116287847 [Actinia tenebrosa]